ncbi:methyltransferase domain-containing protein [Microbacterium hominis]|uniref:Methyltransferase domain-containing protein n=1 Tax=Microbacterium hominis TaxID=162426 RepID=A0A7D4Q3A5_9MICO|nr:methyltransferase domain-containing protein [Microbacterium hominis]QKJ20832.1 methyltransferase domain-containing protein [Microbacterium hominis]
MSLTARDESLVELMDDPACDPVRLAATLRRFTVVNRLVSGWGTVYRTTLGPSLAGLGRPARVLDLGSGGGDVVVRLAARARRDGLDVHWTGAEPDERAHRVALARGADDAIEFRCDDAAALLRAGESFDAVISNHVLHHLGPELPAFAAASRALSRGLVLHSDIARGRLAYTLYSAGAAPLAPGTFLLTDGLRSIRRSFTPAELQAALGQDDPGAWRVARPVPFRLLAVAGRGAGVGAEPESAAGASG